MTFVFTCLYVF